MNFSYRPSKLVSIWIHTHFGIVYLILILRAAVSLYEGPSSFPRFTSNSDPVLAIKRVAGIAYSPFWVISGSPTIGGVVVTTILFALFGYGLLHYGMFMSIPLDRRESMANKVLDFCRMIFFLAGTLLILLMVARMGVLLYNDVTFGRPIIGVPATK